MNCPVCNRPLKSKRSLSRGIGPVCELKVNKLNNEAPKGQTNIDDYIDGQNDGDVKNR